MDMCLSLEWHPGAWVYHWWWEQGSLDMKGMRVAEMTAETEEMEEEEGGGKHDYLGRGVYCCD